MCARALGVSAVATTARTRVCLGGSSVSNSSGRTEFGSCQGRDVDENVFQSLRPAGHLFVAGQHGDVFGRQPHHRRQLAQPVVHGIGVAHGLV